MRVMRSDGGPHSLMRSVRCIACATSEEVDDVFCGPDLRVHDRVAMDEIELYGELIILASGSDGPLSQDEIDAVLGVPPEAA